MIYVVGVLSGILLVAIVGFVILISDVEGGILDRLKQQGRRLNNRINGVKNELDNVKYFRDHQLLDSLMGTIEDYEATKNLEKDKEIARLSKENHDLRDLGLKLVNESDPQKIIELKKLSKEIIEKNPVLSLNFKEEREMIERERKRRRGE